VLQKVIMLCVGSAQLGRVVGIWEQIGFRLQPGKGLMYLFTCTDFSNTGILITILPTCFQSHICECFNFSTCNFKINMNKNSMEYL
jgi:hypothetical protein